MADYCFFVPLLPEQKEAARNFRQQFEANNPDHDRVYAEAGIMEEERWLQQTPMGDFVIVRIVTNDPQRAYNVLATSTDPWAVAFRKSVMETNGMDMTKPANINEQLLHWKSKEQMGV